MYSHTHTHTHTKFKANICGTKRTMKANICFSIEFLRNVTVCVLKRRPHELLTVKCTYVGHYVAISRVHCQGHHLDEPVRVHLPIRLVCVVFFFIFSGNQQCMQLSHGAGHELATEKCQKKTNNIPAWRMATRIECMAIPLYIITNVCLKLILLLFIPYSSIEETIKNNQQTTSSWCAPWIESKNCPNKCSWACFAGTVCFISNVLWLQRRTGYFAVRCVCLSIRWVQRSTILNLKGLSISSSSSGNNIIVNVLASYWPTFLKFYRHQQLYWPNLIPATHTSSQSQIIETFCGF